MVKCLLNRHVLMTFITMLVLCLSCSSCDSLRKKFIRTKKQGQEVKEFQPVLEPQEYPAPEHNPKEIYKQHYALIKVWYKDLWTGVEEKNTDSTVRYAIRQILDRIDQMKPLLKPEKAAALNQLVDLLKFYNDALQQPRMVRNYGRIQSDLRSFDRLFRKEFRQDVIQGDLIAQ